MKESFESSRQWSPETVQGILERTMAIRAELTATGNVDEEMHTLDVIEGHLRQGLLTPREAGERIDAMMASRYER